MVVTSRASTSHARVEQLVAGIAEDRGLTPAQVAPVEEAAALYQGDLLAGFDVSEEPFETWQDQLFCDRAVAMQVPLEAGRQINPFTSATAMSCGWTWEVHLPERRGIGYVYASNFISDEEAERELRRHIGPAAEKISARKLHKRVGRSRRLRRCGSYRRTSRLPLGCAGRVPRSPSGSPAKRESTARCSTRRDASSSVWRATTLCRCRAG